MNSSTELYTFKRESWSGDSRDGKLINGEGFHFFKMTLKGKIIEAFEVYESDSNGHTVVALPEMVGTHWLDDLGFEDLSDLDDIVKKDYEEISNFAASIKK